MPWKPKRRTGGMRINVSVIIAAALALFGVLRYFASSQKNPVTGEAQHVNISPQQEVALGLESAPKMAAEMGGELPDGDPRVAVVRKVGQQLVAQLPQNPWQFKFHVIEDNPKMVNAFALPGGQVFITATLLGQLQDEAQLAGVLGHEVGHVIHRHSAQHIAKGELGQSLVSAVGVGASGQDNGQFAYYAAQMANQMMQLKYGRGDELESDGYGVEMMAKAGYDPREMIGVMEILKKASGGASRPEFASTHPDPGNRAEQIKQQIQQLYPNGVPGNLTKGAPLDSSHTPDPRAPSDRPSPSSSKKPTW